PRQFGTWQDSDIPIPQATRDILGPGDFLLRDYHDQSGQNPDVNLYIAYFPSQRAGDNIHSPENCLPGSGWSWNKRPSTVVSLPGHGHFPVSSAIIAKGDDRRLVIYWFWAHDRGVASEYAEKFYLVVDAIRLHRSDGALFRVVTPMQPDETEDAAQQ